MSAYYSSKLNVMSLSLATEDAGDIIGMGIAFDSESRAADFVDGARRYFETSAPVDRTFTLEFRDCETHCSVIIRLDDGTRSTTLEFTNADRRVLKDVSSALNRQPYIFIIPFFHSPDGLQTYESDNLFIALGSVTIDGLTVQGNRLGKWPRGGNQLRTQ